MKREELEAMGLSEEQIEKIMAENGKDVQAEQAKAVKAKADADKYKSDASKYAEAQAKLDELEKAGMTDVEKTLAEAKKAKEDAEALQSEYAKKSNQIEVEKIFVAAGLKTEDYANFIDGIVGTDAEASKKLAQSFADTISKQREVAIAQTKKDLLKDSDDPDGNGGDGGETKTEAEKLAEKSITSQMEADKSANEGLERFK